MDTSFDSKKPASGIVSINFTGRYVDPLLLFYLYYPTVYVYTRVELLLEKLLFSVYGVLFCVCPVPRRARELQKGEQKKRERGGKVGEMKKTLNHTILERSSRLEVINGGLRRKVVSLFLSHPILLFY